jgi:hypothetical protein
MQTMPPHILILASDQQGITWELPRQQMTQSSRICPQPTGIKDGTPENDLPTIYNEMKVGFKKNDSDLKTK